VRRFEAATGNQAVLVETGETFEALATQGAGTGVRLRPPPAVADVADEPPRNGRLLPVKRAGACTAEVGQRFESPPVPPASAGLSEGSTNFLFPPPPFHPPIARRPHPAADGLPSCPPLPREIGLLI
jgi:hypothetical protein